jgi:hypothetical protein
MLAELLEGLLEDSYIEFIKANKTYLETLPAPLIAEEYH